MDLTGKKVAVYGLGVSGQAVIEFLKSKPISELVIVSRGPTSTWVLPNVPNTLSVIKIEELSSESILAECDLIILSPGIPRESAHLRQAIKKSIPIWNEVELAYHFFKGKIIAVTGTNGKTTTVSFLGQALKRAGKRVFVGGNIGIPFVCALENNNYDYAVLELSSFQCESLEFFHASHNIILNVFPNHGERYATHDDYRQAKWQMLKNTNQNDFILVGEGTKECPYELDASLIKRPENWDDLFKKELPWREMKIIGAHNRSNLYFAWEVFKSLNLDMKGFTQELKTFHAITHRIERLAAVRTIYNDAKSTNWPATKIAIAALVELNQKIILIVGGQKRSKGDYPAPEIIQYLKKHCSVIFCIGEVANDLEKLDKLFINKKTLIEVRDHLLESKEEGTILFSPAYPSFDQFKNYADRGDQFKEIFGAMI